MRYFHYVVIVTLVSGTFRNVSGAQTSDARKIYQQTLQVYKADGDAKAALRGFTDAVETDPNYAPPHFNLALMAGLAGNLKGAAEEFQAYIILAPRGRWVRQAARQLLIVKMWESARVQSADEGGFAKSMVEAWLALKNGDLTSAHASADAAVVRQPNDWRPSLLKGIIFCSAGKYSYAVSSLKKAYKETTGETQRGVRILYARVSEQAAGACLRRRKYAEALMFLQQAGQLYPRSQRLALSTAVAALLGGQMNTARKLLSGLEFADDAAIASNAKQLEEKLSRLHS